MQEGRGVQEGEAGQFRFELPQNGKALRVDMLGLTALLLCGVVGTSAVSVTVDWDAVGTTVHTTPTVQFVRCVGWWWT